MNNIKSYCQIVHRQLSKKGLLFPPAIKPPVKDNAIILLTFLKGPSLLADIFTLTEVDEDSHHTRLVATNSKGEQVTGEWNNGQYTWDNNIEDLHSHIDKNVKRCHSLSFRYHRRRLKQTVQCVKDQIPLCQDLLPTCCKFIDAVIWSKPVKRHLTLGIIATQMVIFPLLFMGDSLIFLLASFLLMGASSFSAKWEDSRYIKDNKVVDIDMWQKWIDATNEVINNPQENKIHAIEELADGIFLDAIKKTSPEYDLLMRTRYRISQEMLDDITQHDALPKTKLLHYRASVIRFILSS